MAEHTDPNRAWPDDELLTQLIKEANEDPGNWEKRKKVGEREIELCKAAGTYQEPQL
jgi:hypothetical protein